MTNNFENEVWKEIPGFENKYEVSSMGRVRSLPRRTSVKNFKGNSYAIAKKGFILTPQKDGCGYLHVRLVKDRRYILYKVHQLVGAAFLGYDRKNKENLVIDHLNGIKHDNRVENLEVVTRKENSQRFWNSEKSEETKKNMRKPHSKRKGEWKMIYINLFLLIYIAIQLTLIRIKMMNWWADELMITKGPLPNDNYFDTLFILVVLSPPPHFLRFSHFFVMKKYLNWIGDFWYEEETDFG